MLQMNMEGMWMRLVLNLFMAEVRLEAGAIQYRFLAAPPQCTGSSAISNGFFSALDRQSVCWLHLLTVFSLGPYCSLLYAQDL